MPKDDETTLREHERGVWNELFGDDAKSKENRQSARSEFKRFFSEGHRTHINGVFEDLAESAKAGKELEFPFHICNDVHPRAWDIILQHGKHYTPRSWRDSKPWEWKRQPLSRSCFFNALEMIYIVREQEPKSRATYVEGFCMGPLVHPMLHAWNGVGFAGICCDWSFYASSMFTRYFGVPFTFEEYQHINQNGKDFSARLMFRRDQFEKVEERVLEVLQKPRTRLMRPKSS